MRLKPNDTRSNTSTGTPLDLSTADHLICFDLFLVAVAAAGWTPEQNSAALAALTLGGLWRLKPWRGQPFSHMRGVFVLLGFS